MTKEIIEDPDLTLHPGKYLFLNLNHIQGRKIRGGKLVTGRDRIQDQYLDLNLEADPEAEITKRNQEDLDHKIN